MLLTLSDCKLAVESFGFTREEVQNDDDEGDDDDEDGGGNGNYFVNDNSDLEDPFFYLTYRSLAPWANPWKTFQSSWGILRVRESNTLEVIPLLAVFALNIRPDI